MSFQSIKRAVVIGGLVASSVLLTAQQALADARDFVIINGSSQIFTHLYVGPSESNDWGPDVMGRDVINPGDQWTITFGRFDPGGCLNDISVNTRDGKEFVLYKLDLCVTDTITISDAGLTPK